MLRNKKSLATIMATSVLLTACGGSGNNDKLNSADNNPASGSNTSSGAGSTNAAPSVDLTSFTTAEDTLLSDKIVATDADNDALSYQLVTTAKTGELTLKSNGEFHYQPAANYFGPDAFTVAISDGKETVNVDFALTVTSVNDVPTAEDVTTYTRLGQAVTFSIPASDVEGEPLTFRLESQPAQGSAIVNNNNSITYTPTEQALGLDEFKIRISDGTDSVSAAIQIDNALALQGELNLSGADLDDVQLLLSGEGVLQRVTAQPDGRFKVYGLADGEYYLKAKKPGYKVSVAQAISLAAEQNKSTQTKSVDDRGTSPEVPVLSFTLEKLDEANFRYHWEEDQTAAGSEYSAQVNQVSQVTFSNEIVDVVDDASADKLRHDYHVLLTDQDDDATWTQEHAYRLLNTMKSIPQQVRNYYNEQSLTPSKWTLTKAHIDNDIVITEVEGVKQVVIAEAAFVNASPKIAKIEGKKGVFYSQRLHHALVRFVTDNGTNQAAVEKILTERYGVTTQIDSYAELTKNTTGSEPSSRFQAFHSEEIVSIINMFEEMPSGMHRLDELQYLVRRLDGQSHPLYASAPAVAWPTEGYIEFMDSAFFNGSIEHTHRLILHEKAHFLWHHQFEQKLKDDWIALGGWYRDENSASGWATTKQTEFVSAYAHAVNPNEDMAESISYFVVNPDKLRSRSVAKYEFIRDRIMQGDHYIAKIREDLTFEVYNLFPDYVFPGKIKRVDIEVTGQPEQDKEVSIELELHALDAQLEGAKSAYMRIFSEIGTYVELYAYPIEGEVGTVLKGTFSLSKHAKAGHWRTAQIVLTDSAGNQRFEGANDFGWKLYINNSMEDSIPPEYVENSLSLDISQEQREGRDIQVLNINWQVQEANGMDSNIPCIASLNDQIPQTYRFDEYGEFDPVTSECQLKMLMPAYMPTSVYSINELTMIDSALNTRRVYFSSVSHALKPEDIVVDEVSPAIDIVTATPDIEPSELDLNNIVIEATPTNPAAPNGETRVKIDFNIRDNISGFKVAELTLRDPQGVSHRFTVFHEHSSKLFPQVDPSEWHTYTASLVLPVGSAPGTWGMSEMVIYDRANNVNEYDFTEIIHFDVMD